MAPSEPHVCRTQPATSPRRRLAADLSPRRAEKLRFSVMPSKSIWRRLAADFFCRVFYKLRGNVGWTFYRFRFAAPVASKIAACSARSTPDPKSKLSGLALWQCGRGSGVIEPPVLQKTQTGPDRRLPKHNLGGGLPPTSSVAPNGAPRFI